MVDPVHILDDIDFAVLLAELEIAVFAACSNGVFGIGKRRAALGAVEHAGTVLVEMDADIRQTAGLDGIDLSAL